MGVGVREEPANDVKVIAAVVGHLGHGAFADVVVAGEAGVSSLMDGRGPKFVVALSVAVGFGEPFLGERFVAWMLVDFPDHRGEKRGLGSGEEVSAVCVKDGSVVFDLEEEVFDHALGKFCAVVFYQSEDDEVAVPAIHLVEAASGYDVAIGEVEQALYGDFSDANVSDVSDLPGKMLYFDVALLVGYCDGGRGFHACRQVEYRRCGHLGIDKGFAVCHGTGEAVPAAVDVGQYLCVGLRVRRGLGTRVADE